MQKKKHIVMREEKAAGEFLKFSGFYVWFLIVPLTAVTLLFKWKNGFFKMGFDLFLWRNLCISYSYGMDLPCNERTFSAKSRRKYSVLMLTVGFMIVCHLLSFWKDTFLYPYFCCYSMYFTGSYFTYGSKWK